MNQERYLQNISDKYARLRQDNNGACLSEVAVCLMENYIIPKQARFGKLAELWTNALPAELAKHCKLVDVRNNQLTVQVDSPSYIYELQLRRPQILETLGENCHGSKIKKIRFVPGKKSSASGD